VSFLLSNFISSRTLSSFLLRHYEISWSHLRKIFRKTRQMRSARVANHFLRAPVALNRPHRRQFAPLIDFFQLSLACSRAIHAANHYLGRKGRRGGFLFYIISIFWQNIRNQRPRRKARCLNERLFRPEKVFWRCSKIRHETRLLSSIAAFNYITLVA